VTGQLVPPSVTYQASYLDAQREFHTEGRNLDIEVDALEDAAAFAAYVDGLIAAARPETPRPEGWVPGTILWYVVDEQFVGQLDIRHELTPALREVGGHIGYEVRPSARRRGHATRMLALSLPIAQSLGIDRALLTCDPANVASQKVIEANRGVRDRPTHTKFRYWISTH
jgi:predicted acetyltransferase